MDGDYRDEGYVTETLICPKKSISYIFKNETRSQFWSLSKIYIFFIMAKTCAYFLGFVLLSNDMWLPV